MKRYNGDLLNLHIVIIQEEKIQKIAVWRLFFQFQATWGIHPVGHPKFQLSWKIIFSGVTSYG